MTSCAAKSDARGEQAENDPDLPGERPPEDCEGDRGNGEDNVADELATVVSAVRITGYLACPPSRDRRRNQGDNDEDQ